MPSPQIANRDVVEQDHAAVVTIDHFTDGVLDPSRPMYGPVRDGGTIRGVTAPGCWGPMITPAIRGGHEGTIPVAVSGAEVGDAITITVSEVRNRATVNGAIEIGRHPGVVQITFLAPLRYLDARGLGKIARKQYGICWTD